MIHAKSRYVNGKVVPLQDKTVMVVRNFPAVTNLYYEYIWKESDRLDRVAGAFLASPMDWWKILDANPLLQNPTDIRPGMIIRIPRNA